MKFHLAGGSLGCASLIEPPRRFLRVVGRQQLRVVGSSQLLRRVAQQWDDPWAHGGEPPLRIEFIGHIRQDLDQTMITVLCQGQPGAELSFFQYLFRDHREFRQVDR